MEKKTNIDHSTDFKNCCPMCFTVFAISLITYLGGKNKSLNFAELKAHRKINARVIFGIIFKLLNRAKTLDPTYLFHAYEP